MKKIFLFIAVAIMINTTKAQVLLNGETNDIKEYNALCWQVPESIVNSENEKLFISGKYTFETKTLKSGQFGSPTFSSDGKFILFKRDFKENKLKVWSSDFYIIDVATLTEQKISNAYSAQWVDKKGL